MIETIQVRRLSAEQQAAHDTLVAYARGHDKTDVMKVLEGYAGTGKTTTLTEVVKTLKIRDPQLDVFDSGYQKNIRIAATAPTHKAVRVMKKFSTFSPDDVEFATIHSLLGLEPQVNEKTGKEVYVQSKDPNRVRIEDYDLILIDEASMLNDELFDFLLPHVRDGKKIIFIGDPVQIPPVNQADAKPFLPEYQSKHRIGVVRLSKIMRQGEGNPILQYATRIRMEYDSTERFMVETCHLKEPYPHGIIRIDSDEACKEVIKQYFDTEEFRKDADYMKIIAYRNSIVNGFNIEVRKILYPQPEGQDVPYLVQGEKLIIDKPVVMPSGRILLHTNEEVVVDSFSEKTGRYDFVSATNIVGQWHLEMRYETFRYYDTLVSYENWKGEKIGCNIRILHESEHTRLATFVQEIKYAAQSQPHGHPLRSKLWVSYYKVQKLFAQVKYNYAITGHKSQGSTYDNAMVVEWDIDTNRKLIERNRIRYVAVTRARNQLFIVK